MPASPPADSANQGQARAVLDEVWDDRLDALEQRAERTSKPAWAHRRRSA
jgi:hypothetical protein